MEKENKLPSIEKFYNDIFFIINSEILCYDASGSFLGFLYLNYGKEKFLELLRNLNFHKTFKKNLRELNDEWKYFLRKIKTFKEEKETIVRKYEYFSPSYLKCKCPQVGNLEKDYKELSWDYDIYLDPQLNYDIYSKLSKEEKGNFKWQRNLIYSLIGMKDFEKAKSQALKLKEKFKNEIYEINLILFWISIYGKDDDEAIRHMEELAKISGEDSFENLKFMILKN